MKNSQRGFTFLSFLIVGSLVAVVGFAGLIMAPAYLEYGKIARVFDQIQQEYSNTEGGLDETSLRKSLDRRWNIEDIKSISFKDVDITRKDNGYEVSADYEVEVPYLYNVALLVKFNKTVYIKDSSVQ